MKKNKICILGYDGLEYSLVKKFNLKNLKQLEYGKTDISEFSIASTPLLWASFLTGKKIDIVSRRFIFEKKIIGNIILLFKKNMSEEIWESLKVLSPIIRKTREIIKGDINKKIKDAWKLNKQTKTIFDFFKKSKAINVPTYNTDGYKERGLVVEFVLGNPIESIKKIEQDFQKTRKELLKNLNKYELIMAWFQISDLWGHKYRGDLSKMYEVYKKLDNLTKEVKKRFNGWILIISDHGMKKIGKYGDHTDIKYGYYSSNIKLGLKNPKITEFYKLIIKKSCTE